MSGLLQPVRRAQGFVNPFNVVKKLASDGLGCLARLPGVVEAPERLVLVFVAPRLPCRLCGPRAVAEGA